MWAAECIKLALNHFFLYRGGQIKKDKIHTKNNEPCGLSYGPSPYAGAVYDSRASAAHFMGMHYRDAFIVPVPFNQVEDDIYCIPRSHAVCQLTAKGEYFHGRFKIPAGLSPDTKIYGLYGYGQVAYKNVPDEFKSKFTSEESEKKFEESMEQIISLK